ncbi:MAG: AAA-associated domain-containing protein [Candidatus Micrarchaeota archaeon]
MVKHKIVPIPDASVGRVLGLIEVLYSYGAQVKISFLSEELRMPIDELGAVVDMAKLFGLLKVNNGIATLTIYGEALSLGTVDDKKKIFKKKILTIEPFNMTTTILKKEQKISEDALFKKISEKYPIQDKEKFHKLFVGWGTYVGLFEYDGQKRRFSACSETMVYT